MAGTVVALGGNRDRVGVGSEPAAEREVDFDLFPRGETAQMDLFNFCISAVDIHADPVADQNPHHGVHQVFMKYGADADSDLLSAVDDA